MKMMFGLISVILTFICFSVFAKTGNFEAIQIKPIHHLSPMDLNSRTFAGSICFNKPATQTVPTICGTLSEIQQTHKFRFFFPNLETEVTSNVTLQDASLGQSFSYSASIPVGTETPVFYIVTELLNENLIDQVRIEKSLEAQIASYTTTPPSSLTQQLASVQAQLLENYPAAVYEWVHPRKGKLNPPLRFTTHNKNYRVEFKFDRPDIFIGEKSKVRFKLKSLRPGAQTQDIYSSRFETTEWHSNKVTANVISLASAVPETSVPGTRKIEFRTSLLGKTYHYSTIPLEFHHPTLEDLATPEVEGGVSEKVFAGGEKIEIKFNDPTGRMIQGYLPNFVTRINSSGQALQDYTCDVIPAGGKYTIGINGIAGSESFLVRSQDSNLPEGLYKFRFINVVDHAYHVFNQEIPVRIDASAPTIQFAFDDNYITNESNFNLPLSVFDALDTTLSVWINGLEIFSGAGNSFDIPMALQEGVNLITFIATDSQGNQVSVQRSVILDRTPPQLAEISPAQGQSIATQSFIARGKANENISQAFINNIQATIANGRDFSAPVTAYIEGSQSLEIRLVDLVGNENTFTTTYSIAKPLLHIDLVSITPGLNDKLIVTGAPGSARENVTLNIESGFFNSEEVTPNADGSFSVELDFFSSVEITAIDDNFEFEEVYNVNYNVDTTLSGIIRDPNDVPLPGVVVTILSSGQTSTTNASGVFAIPNPALGDQDLKIDGRTIPEEVTQGLKEFSAVNMKVAIGNRQQNVIDRPIYISPKLLDGTETEVEATSATVVSSSHAPGVEIDIPAGKAVFPSGGQSGSINIMEIAADKTSVEMPDRIQPESVYALEPSGLKFSERVKLTLPNTNDFPEGTELVIMSKNSQTGTWEVDGSATVASSGEIETKPGLGISHFSEVFAVPFGMEITSMGNKDRPGIDNQVGQLSTTVSLPSYQRLGSSIVPKLVYKSQWADPFVTVSNVFNLPRKHIPYPSASGGGNFIGIKEVKVSESIQTWITPDSISTQFFIGNNSSPKYVFQADKAPEKAVVTYGVDLSDLETGLYPSLANYEIKYRTLTIRTTKKSNREWFGKTKTTVKTTVEQDLIDSIFPPDLTSFVYHQNRKASEFGAGWKFAASQKIVNPDGDRIMIENEDGSVSSYTLKNSLETVVHDADGIQSLNAQGNQAFYATALGDVKSVVQGSQNPNLEFSSPSYVGGLGVNSIRITSQSRYCWSERWDGSCREYRYKYTYQCEKSTFNHSLSKKINSIVQLLDGSFLYLDQYGAIYTNAGAETLYSGTINNLQTISLEAGNSDFQSQCRNQIQQDCDPSKRVNYTSFPINNKDYIYPVTACGSFQPSSGIFPKLGYSSTSLSQSTYNNPTSMIPAPVAGILYVVDTGNNIVRRLNTQNGTSTIFAGNQQTYDNGDGGQATAASMYHPRGLTHDSLGNIYISTENGLIRKVSASGIISTIAGKNLQAGASQFEVAPMNEFYLSSPSGLVIDEEKGYLYVADTGNNRIVQMDLINGIGRVIAGNRTCETGPFKEGLPALESSICSPTHLALDQDKNLLVLDKAQDRIRRFLVNSTTSGVKRFASSGKDNSELVREADGTFHRNYRDGSIVFYDVTGKQVKHQDLTGRETLFTYNEDNRLTTVTDPTGSELEVTYSGDKVTQIIDPAGRVTNFSYNGNNLSEVQFADGTSKAFSYDANGLMTQEVDQRGYATQYTFNSLKKLSTIKTPDNAIIQLQDSDSKTYYNSFDSGERRLVNYDGTNSDALSDSIKNPKSAETTFVKETNGYVSKIIDAEGKITIIDRDLEGRPIKILRPDTTFTEFTYSQTTGDLLTRYESSTTSSESFTYNLQGLLTQHTDPLGKISTKTYDPVTGLLLTETDPRGATVSRSYGSLGLVTSISNSYNQTQSFEYGIDGNLLKSISPLGESTVYTRDNAGNIITKRNAKNETTHYTVDSFNRLLSVTTPSAQLTSYNYLPTGELSLITNPLGHETAFAYNVMGRLTSKTSPTGQITQLAYDQVGNVIQEITPNGHVKSFEYNLLDQLTRKTLPDNIYNYSYTDSGEVESVSDNSSAFEYSYTTIHGKKYVSAINQAVLDISPNVLNYSWDASGKKTTMESDFISYAYLYNNSDRIQKVTNSKGEQFGFAFDFANRLTSMSRPNSLSTNYSFDANSFLTQINHKISGTAISSFGYQRDQVNNRTSMTTLHGVHSYQYDNEGQLVSATHPEAGAAYALESFAFDDLGNRTSDNQGSFSYDLKKHRLEEDWKYLYAYDLSGNLISKQEKGFGKVWNYSYSSENQLTVAEYSDNNVVSRRVEMTYDALGRRVQKKVIENSTTKIRKFVYDGNEIIAELSGNNSVLVKYTHSGQRMDDVLAMDVTSAGVSEGFAPAAGTFYFLKDGLGSIVDIANSAGTIVQHYSYSSFGKLLKIENGGVDNTANPAIKSPFTYTNREYDPELGGLYYYRARWYDSHSGRFLQEDPDTGSLGGPGSFNTKYAYVGNNPMNYIDPLGLFSINIGKALNSGYEATFKRAFHGAENIWNKNQAEIIAGIVVVSSVVVVATVGSPLLVGALITGGISAGFTGFKGGDSKDVAKSFLGGFAAGVITGGLATGAAGLAGGIKGQMALGAMGGAFGGGISAFVNAQIKDGDWRKASGESVAFGALGGAVGGMIAGPILANSAGGGLAGATSGTATSTVGEAVCHSGCTNTAGTWVSK